MGRILRLEWQKGAVSLPAAFPKWILKSGAKLSVRQGFVKSGAFAQFAHFQNLAAIQTLNVLRIIILGDETRMSMFAWRFRHGGLPNEFDYSTPISSRIQLTNGPDCHYLFLLGGSKVRTFAR
jgi:predicted hotdog family 3-hydroxylacyl-ACP dehydratase